MHSFPPFPRISRIPVSLAIAVVVALAGAGCATRSPVPVEERTVPRVATQPRAVAPALPPVAPGEVTPNPTYTVKRGDTLHQIALDNGLDYRELAAWNNIENVNRIYPGQVLRLTAPGEAPAAPQPGANGVTTAPLRTPPPIGEASPPVAAPLPSAAPSPAPASSAASANVKTSPKAIKEPYSEQVVRDMNLAASAGPAPATPAAPPPPPASGEPRPDAHAAAAPPGSGGSAPAAPSASGAGSGSASQAPSADADRLDWSWPAKGKIVANFSETANLKGIDIAGTAGEPVRASAPGRVVYAGNGLRGYGKLIIIKHNATYLSAYAHNREILVKEGQQVTRGQKIAEMGNTDADQVKLHFEIRRHGKPMDPTKFLPPT